MLRYCEVCGVRLGNTDFVKERAFEWEGRVWCHKHVPDEVRTRLAKARKGSTSKMTLPSSSSGQVPSMTARKVEAARKRRQSADPDTTPLVVTEIDRKTRAHVHEQGRHHKQEVARKSRGWAVGVIVGTALICFAAIGAILAMTPPAANPLAAENATHTPVRNTPAPATQDNPAEQTVSDGPTQPVTDEEFDRRTAYEQYRLEQIRAEAEAARARIAANPRAFNFDFLPDSDPHFQAQGRGIIEDIRFASEIAIRGLTARVQLVGTQPEYRFLLPRDEPDRRKAMADFDGYGADRRRGAARPVMFATPFGDMTYRWVVQTLDAAQEVRVELDDLRTPTADNGSWLGYIFYRTGTEDPVWYCLNYEMIAQGYSPYYTEFGYLTRFHDRLAAAQAEARSAQLGIWSGQERSYRDYDERLEWWTRCAQALSAFDELFPQPLAEGTPLDLDRGRVSTRDWQPRLGRTVEVLARVPARARSVNPSAAEVTLRNPVGDSVIVRFASPELFRTVWDDRRLLGEVLRVRGQVARQGEGWVIRVDSPQDVQPFLDIAAQYAAEPR